jgi:hypothetical protein
MAGTQTSNQAGIITEDTTILAPPRATKEQAIAFITRRGSTEYTDADINLIVNHYWNIAVPAGVDPLLAVAQSIHETSDHGHPMSSWWARRPRRNPAGIGVTGGHPRTTDPQDPHKWALDDSVQPQVWRAGLSFASWELGVKAQVGRLLAFALPAGQGTNIQKELINFALGERPLPAVVRGTAPTLKLLGAHHNPTGQGWAFKGITYGAKIAAIAQAIKNTVV